MIPLQQLIYFLLYVLIGGAIVYAIYWFLGLLAIPQPIKQIILFIIAIFAIIWLLSILPAIGVLPK